MQEEIGQNLPAHLLVALARVQSEQQILLVQIAGQNPS